MAFLGTRKQPTNHKPQGKATPSAAAAAACMASLALLRLKITKNQLHTNRSIQWSRHHGVLILCCHTVPQSLRLGTEHRWLSAVLHIIYRDQELHWSQNHMIGGRSGLLSFKRGTATTKNPTANSQTIILNMVRVRVDPTVLVDWASGWRLPAMVVLVEVSISGVKTASCKRRAMSQKIVIAPIGFGNGHLHELVTYKS